MHGNGRKGERWLQGCTDGANGLGNAANITIVGRLAPTAVNFPLDGYSKSLRPPRSRGRQWPIIRCSGGYPGPPLHGANPPHAANGAAENRLDVNSGPKYRVDTVLAAAGAAWFKEEASYARCK